MLPLPSSKYLFLIFSLIAIQSLGLSRQFAASKLFNFSHAANQQRLSPATLVKSSRQSSDTETFPVCDFDFALEALEIYNECADCQEAISYYNNLGMEHPSLSCPPECCANVDLSAAIGHFRICKNRCCYRLVSLQLSPGLTPEQGAFVIQSQGFAVNEATFVNRTSLGKCVVSEGPSDDPKCGPRCATQIQDRTACSGRNTAEVPRFGRRMRLPPCSSGFPDGPPQDSGSDTPTTDQATPETPNEEVGETQTTEEDGGGQNEENGASGGTEGTSEAASGDGNSQTQNERACFPAKAHVTLQHGGKKALRALRVGEVVLSDKGVYTPIIGFSHADPTARTVMLSITLASGHVLTVSQGHYVHTKGGLVTARRVRPGDAMKMGNGTWRVVVSVEMVEEVGLYSPQTADGGIVVDGVFVSCYTEAIAPVTAHALLVPVRMGALPWGKGLAGALVERAAEIWRGCVEAW